MSKISLKIATWNLCNGLTNKVQYVKDMLQTHDMDIIFLQETEIKMDYDVKLLNIRGYTLESSKSKNMMQTVAYIKDNVIYKRVNEKRTPM